MRDKERLEIESTPASRMFARAWRWTSSRLTLEKITKAWKSVIIWSFALMIIGFAVWAISNVDNFEGGRVKGASIQVKTKRIQGHDYEGLEGAILGMQLQSIEYHSSAKTLLGEGRPYDALVEINNALECLRGGRMAFSEIVRRHGHMLTIVEERRRESKLLHEKREVLETKEKIKTAIWENSNEAERLAAQKEREKRERVEQADRERQRKERGKRDQTTAG